MKSFEYSFSLLCLCLLNGCGFQPLYRQDKAPQELQAVKIDVIADRSGQELRNFLIDAMTESGGAASKKYRLHITLRETKRQIAFRKDFTPRHTEVVITATVELKTIPEGLLLFSDKIVTIASFSLDALSSHGAFSAETAEKTARANGLKNLSDDITLRVATFLVEHNLPDEG